MPHLHNYSFQCNVGHQFLVYEGCSKKNNSSGSEQFNAFNSVTTYSQIYAMYKQIHTVHTHVYIQLDVLNVYNNIGLHRYIFI